LRSFQTGCARSRVTISAAEQVVHHVAREQAMLTRLMTVIDSAVAADSKGEGCSFIWNAGSYYSLPVKNVVRCLTPELDSTASAPADMTGVDD
jgi:hypothetical protein